MASNPATHQNGPPYPVTVEFGTQCNNSNLKKQLSGVYLSVPQELQFEPIVKWGRNKQRTEPIRCKICLQLHPVNDCQVFKCKHCSIFHTIFGNCSFYNNRLRRKDSITLAASALGTCNSMQQRSRRVVGSGVSGVSGVSCVSGVEEDSSHPEWRKSKPTNRTGTTFNKKHWKKNYSHYTSL